MFGNFLAACKAILDMQPDRILDVLHGFFVRISLAVTTLKPRTGNKVAVGVSFYHVRQRKLFHPQIIGSL